MTVNHRNAEKQEAKLHDNLAIVRMREVRKSIEHSLREVFDDGAALTPTNVSSRHFVPALGLDDVDPVSQEEKSK